MPDFVVRTYGRWQVHRYGLGMSAVFYRVLGRWWPMPRWTRHFAAPRTEEGE